MIRGRLRQIVQFLNITIFQPLVLKAYMKFWLNCYMTSNSPI